MRDIVPKVERSGMPEIMFSRFMPHLPQIALAGKLHSSKHTSTFPPLTYYSDY